MHVRIDLTLPRLPRRRLWRVGLAAILTLVLAVPGLALASHQFGDVPTSHPFHGDISAIADAGVTSGCGGGDYCPDRNVTRAEMAAFMNRLGALASNKTPVVNADKVDGLDSTEFLQSSSIVTSIGGSAWQPHSGLPSSSVVRGATFTTFSADGNVVLPIPAPNEVGGISYRMSSLRICYQRSAPGYIAGVDIARTDDPSAQTDLVLHDGNNRTQSTECFSIATGANVWPGQGLALNVYLLGGVSGSVQLGGVKATWVPT